LLFRASRRPKRRSGASLRARPPTRGPQIGTACVPIERNRLPALLAAHSSVGALQPLKIACVFQSSYCCQGIAAKTLLLACKPHSVRISRLAEAQGIAPCTASSAVELLPLGFCPKLSHREKPRHPDGEGGGQLPFQLERLWLRLWLSLATEAKPSRETQRRAAGVSSLSQHRLEAARWRAERLAKKKPRLGAGMLQDGGRIVTFLDDFRKAQDVKVTGALILPS
jgi:hypothetical protein